MSKHTKALNYAIHHEAMLNTTLRANARNPWVCPSAFLSGNTQTVRSNQITTYFIVGMTNSAPARMPVGQREVTVFSRV